MRRGFTLIEVMVTVTLLAVIILGLVTAFNVTQRAFSQSLTQVDTMENARLAAGMLALDMEQISTVNTSNGPTFFSSEVVTNVWALPGTNQLTNVLSHVWFHTGDPRNVRLTYYTVNSDSNGIGPLMIMVGTNTNAIVDGVVSFRALSLDKNGSQTYALYTGNDLPHAVQLELGILEKRTVDQYHALSNSPLARQFLTNQAGHLHIFRQRITVKAAQP